MPWIPLVVRRNAWKGRTLIPRLGAVCAFFGVSFLVFLRARVSVMSTVVRRRRRRRRQQCWDHCMNKSIA